MIRLDKNVAIVITDALRFDKAINMTGLRSFWNQSVFFKRAYGVAHCSDPNFVSLLTGLHVDSHQVYTNYPRNMPYERPFLQTLLLGHGYDIAFCGFRWADEAEAGEPPTSYVYWDGWPVDFLNSKEGNDFKNVLSQVKRVLERIESPWFILVRLMHTHRVYTGGTYNKAIKQLDADLADLVPLFDDAYVLAILSDHGEELGYHGSSKEAHGHNYHLWEGLIHVPLAIRCPDFNPGVLDNLVQHPDLPVTLCDLIGVDIPWDVDGRSLVPLMASGGNIEWRSQLHFGGIGTGPLHVWKHRAVISERYKLIRGIKRGENPIDMLFDILDDPLEARPVDEIDNIPAQKLKDRLVLMMIAWMKRCGVLEQFSEGFSVDEEKEIMERLRGWGYTW